jgi:hypothetical protein
MLQALKSTLRPSISDSLANAFSRLGWTGFWIQIAIGIIPLTLIIYSFISGQSASAGTGRGLLLVGYLTIAGFLVLIFTTMWSYRYTRLAERHLRFDAPPIFVLGAESCLDRRGVKRSRSYFRCW